MYLKATIFTILGWFIGLILDANVDFGDPMGFLSLRILLPILAMGLCILHELRRANPQNLRLTRLNLCIFTVKTDIFIAKTLAMYGKA